jgi:hypothetical protein
MIAHNLLQFGFGFGGEIFKIQKDFAGNEISPLRDDELDRVLWN